MPFIYYDLAIFAAFCVFVVLFLLLKRSRVKREGILFLYRTKAGLRAIERLAKKLSGLWKRLGSVVIVLGWLLMAGIFVLLIQSIIFTFKMPLRAPPILPLVPYLPQALKIPGLPPFYFTYWLVIIAIVAVTHEFAHGIFARLHSIKVKSTGFGFLGPFLLAFVEPDEKQMARKKKKAQLEILAAGSFSNFVFAIIFVLLMQLFFLAAYQPAGLAYSLAYTSLNFGQIDSIGNRSVEEFFNLSDAELEAINATLPIETENATYWLTPEMIKTIPSLRKALLKQQALAAYEDSPAFRANLSGGLIAIDGQKIKSPEHLATVLSAYKPGETVQVTTSEDSYQIELAQSKTDPQKGYLGVGFPQLEGAREAIARLTAPYFSLYTHVKVRGNEEVTKFFSDLLLWLVLICFFVALFNMLPVGFLDGGKFIYISALALTRSKKSSALIFRISSYVVFIIFMLLIFAWLLA